MPDNVLFSPRTDLKTSRYESVREAKVLGPVQMAVANGARALEANTGGDSRRSTNLKTLRQRPFQS